MDAFITEAWQLCALYGGLFAVAMGAVWAPLAATVSRWCDASRRGTAIGIGQVGIGRLCDTLGPQQTYRLSLVISALGMVAFARNDGFTSIAITDAILGFGIGRASIQITTVSIDLFGTATAGILMGSVLTIVGLLGAGGPLASGAIHDVTLSYTPAVYMGAAVLLAVIMLSFGLQRK